MSITTEGLAGMQSAAQHAEDVAPGWAKRAYAMVIKTPIIFGATTPFTMEEARNWAYHMGLDQPAEERAWGGVTARLVREGIIEPVGYAPAASSHGSPKRTYRIKVRP
jgi:hypothetical protein